MSSLTAVLAACGSEIYPTRIRSRGTGLAAVAVLLFGVETRRRRLEAITVGEFGRAAGAPVA